MVSLRTPSRLFVGDDSLAELTTLAREHRHIALFTDAVIKAAGLAEVILPALQAGGARVTVLDQVASEPTFEQAERVIDLCRRERPSMIVALGGGSVMDVAKLASLLCDDAASLRALAVNPSAGRKRAFSVMVPTTAGTGAEATPNAIVTDTEQKLKIGIVCADMIPDAVFLMPRMTASLPQAIAASAGVDALAHAIECYTSVRATRLSDLYAMEAMRSIFPNAVKACNLGDADARKAMLLGAYYAGVAICGSGTTAVHALSYPLGGRFHVPHGVANAVLLEPVMRFNLPACTDRLATVHDALYPDETSLNAADKARLVVEALGRMVRELRIPSDYSAYGVRSEHLDSLVEAGMRVTRLLHNNPRAVTSEDARAIYSEVLPE